MTGSTLLARVNALVAAHNKLLAAHNQLSKAYAQSVTTLNEAHALNTAQMQALITQLASMATHLQQLEQQAVIARVLAKPEHRTVLRDAQGRVTGTVTTRDGV